MSIKHLVNPEEGDRLLNIVSNSVNVYNLSFANTSILASQTNFIIGGIDYIGTSLSSHVAKVVYKYSSGVVGTCTVAIKSANFATTYFSAVMPSTGGIQLVNLAKVADLPATETALVIVYTTDASFNHPTDSIIGLFLN